VNLRRFRETPLDRVNDLIHVSKMCTRSVNERQKPKRRLGG